MKKLLIILISLNLFGGKITINGEVVYEEPSFTSISIGEITKIENTCDKNIKRVYLGNSKYSSYLRNKKYLKIGNRLKIECKKRIDKLITGKCSYKKID
jgi:hypothetical protein